MARIVQKFGGSSVANAERIFRVAKIITDSYAKGNEMCVVLSAQGDTTDDLIAKAEEINPNASKREMDMLLACGEQMSIALMAMAIEKLGYPVVSLCGWQVGMNTSSTHSFARIKKVTCERVKEELDKKRIVLVAGFQGVDKYGDVTTLGRGGSDTTAVAMAIALQADLCQIFTDVDGVYTCDPRIVPEAKKLPEITYNEMLELASLGAQVLNNRSVELAKSYGVQLEVPARGYTILSVNSMLASLNSFLVFCGRADCKVKLYRVQKKTYLAANRELSKAEYQRLLHAARKDQRLWLLLQTLCATGIRVSELQYFTVEAVRAGEISVACKSKTRSILIPRGLQNILLQYVRSAEIESGHIFRTRTGKPMNRSNIWSAMKRLCAQANVNPDKVFPHNLRKLFARTFYRMEKDIAKLADILGHSSINTTRIYIMSTGTEHRHQMEKLGLLA